jgi:hypothetical protein
VVSLKRGLLSDQYDEPTGLPGVGHRRPGTIHSALRKEELRTANRDENADLFWAVRGGGDNFDYVNFQLTEDDGTRTVSAYGKNYVRLQQVKSRYDPGNLFRVNRNIPPAR